MQSELMSVSVSGEGDEH